MIHNYDVIIYMKTFEAISNCKVMLSSNDLQTIPNVTRVLCLFDMREKKQERLPLLHFIVICF